MADSYKLTEKAARHAAETYRRSVSEATDHDLTGRSQRPAGASGTSINWQRGRNGAGASIPAWSCVAIGAITGGSSSTYPGDGYCASLTKPAGASGVQYGLTGINSCAATGPSGQPTLCSFHLESGWVTYDTGTPNPGEIWGPKSGQWTASKGQPGFVVVRIVDAGRKLMLVKPTGGGGTLLATATLSVSMPATAGTYAISAITPFDGSTDSSSTVSNPEKHAAANGASIIVAKDMSSGSAVWKVIDAPKTDVTVLTWSGSALATRVIAVETDGAAGTLPTTPCSS